MADGDESVSSLPGDILRSHIITRLDGLSLAAVAAASSELRVLASDDHLWENVCIATWPSIGDPRVRRAIASFRDGYRSFFYDSFNRVSLPRSWSNKCKSEIKSPATTELISAVDVYYKGRAIFSKVLEIMVTKNEMFSCSPFRVDLEDEKEVWHQWEQRSGEESDLWLADLENNVTLSWILINPVSSKAVNLSSRRPVMSQRHWINGDVQLKFAVIMDEVDETKKGLEWVECKTVITLGGWKDGEEVHVKEACMSIEDMEGGALSGKESLSIILNAMEKGAARKRLSGENEEKKIFQEFLERKQCWNLRRKRKDKAMDIASNVLGITIVLLFWLWLFGPFP